MERTDMNCTLMKSTVYILSIHLIFIILDEKIAVLYPTGQKKNTFSHKNYMFYMNGYEYLR